MANSRLILKEYQKFRIAFQFTSILEVAQPPSSFWSKVIRKNMNFLHSSYLTQEILLKIHFWLHTSCSRLEGRTHQILKGVFKRPKIPIQPLRTFCKNCGFRQYLHCIKFQCSSKNPLAHYFHWISHSVFQ